VEEMKKLIVKDRKLAKKLEDRLIKKGLVVAAQVVIQVKNA
jgi:hypothetical protein